MRPGAGHIAKDRTGKLGDFVKPDWNYIENLLDDSLDTTPKKEVAPTQKIQEVPQEPQATIQDVEPVFPTQPVPQSKEQEQEWEKNKDVREVEKNNTLESKTIKELSELAQTLGKEIPAGSLKADIINILKG
jgi:hypothetical protein